MSNEVKQGLPKRIYIHPASAEYNVNPWPLEPSEYTEYVRREEREAAFKEAIATIKKLVCPAQFEGNWRNGYSHAQNDSFRAIERLAALEASAS